MAKPKKEQVSITITPKVRRKVDAAARAEGRSRSNMIEKLLCAGLKDPAEQPKGDAA